MSNQHLVHVFSQYWQSCKSKMLIELPFTLWNFTLVLPLMSVSPTITAVAQNNHCHPVVLPYFICITVDYLLLLRSPYPGEHFLFRPVALDVIRSVVYVFVSLCCEQCKVDWTDRDAIWGRAESCGPKKPRIRCGSRTSRRRGTLRGLWARHPLHDGLVWFGTCTRMQPIIIII